MHTPTPWTTENGVIYSTTSGDTITRPVAQIVTRYDQDAMEELPTSPEDLANAELIVRAVN